MIPIKLQIKNFLSYGPKLQTIDFGPYPLICLSGKNGHGKSALLDAMTWALWGQARKISGVAKPDAQLLRLGQTNMIVIFDFAFNRQQYRIKREFACVHNKPYASLEFGILDSEHDSIRPLTDKTIRATQDLIEHTIGLDYDAFINSAFLRQGQSNEFSKKSPKERKDILASILQLHEYELMRKIAVDKTKVAQTHVHHLNQLQERITVELQKITEIQTQVLEINKRLHELSCQEELHKTSEEQLIQEKQLVHEQHQRYQMHLFALQQHALIATEKEQKLRSIFTQWRTINKQLYTTVHSPLLEQERERVINQINQCQQQLQKTLTLKESFLRHKEIEQRLINQLHEQHQATITKHQAQIDHLKIEHKSKEFLRSEIIKRINQHHQELQQINKELQQLQIQLQENNKDKQYNQTLEQQFEKRKGYYHTWVARAQVLHQELENLKQKTNLTHDPANPSCPLCEQNLSASRKRFLKTKFSKSEHFLQHRLVRLTTIINELKAVLIKNHAQLSTLKQMNEHYTLLQAKFDDFTKEQKKLIMNSTDLEEHNTKLNQELQQIAESLKKEETLLVQSHEEKHRAIEQNPEYQQLKTTLNQLTTESQAIVYDIEHHHALIKNLEIIEAQRKQIELLSDEKGRQQQRKEDIHTLCLELRNLKKQKQALENQAEQFSMLEHKATNLATQEKELYQKKQLVFKHKEALLQEKGRLENQQQTLCKLQEEHTLHQKTITTLNQTIDDYQTLATALGKDGIQALLIEDAIPEIEHEANALLAQLTDNQAHIFIDSLRDLKKGGTKETLDIKISDPMGIRPYELFSGGEAFRIDFALRIAISKLLARRAGTSLQTLIIDEGFGSQDEDGLSHLMDAIIKIQESFAKVIIVSHLTAMKDQFPVHFIIEKGPYGSTVNVIEND